MRIASVVTLLSGVFAGCQGCSHVTYYAPVLGPEARDVAYVKRTSTVSSPLTLFGTGKQTFAEDRLAVCTARVREDGSRHGEACSEAWALPLAKVGNGGGRIEAWLNWEGPDLRYRISLAGFDVERTPIGVRGRRRPFGQEYVLANVDPLRDLASGPAVRAGHRVALSEEPLRFAFPIDNDILIGPAPAAGR